MAIGNAGIVESAPFLEVTAEQWQAHLDVNLGGCFNVGQIAARLMVERGRPGQVLFTGSWVGEIPWPEIAPVLRVQGRRAGCSRARWRVSSRRTGSASTSSPPGSCLPGMARRQYETDPAYARRASVVVPLGELGTPEQVAQATAFLCSPEAAYMTGSVLLVDGGASLFQFAE